MLVRELSRDTVELLRAVVGSTSFPNIPPARLAALSGTNSAAFGSARRTRNATGRIALRVQRESPSDSPVLSPREGRGAADSKGGPPLNSIAWDRTVASALLPVRRLHSINCT